MMLIPRVIRLKDAAAYLGMDKNRFDREVRPFLTEIPIGDQGIGFDRLDLDNWLEDYKARNGRPGKAMRGGKPWDAKRRQVSSYGQAHGTCKKDSEVKEFEKALERVTSTKRKAT